MEPDEDLYRRQLHIFEAEWKPADRCGTPGCTLADFHDGLCSTEQVLGRRKRPAPAAPARASGSVRGGGPKKHASIVLDDDGVSQEDDASQDDDDDSLSLQHSAGPDPDPEGFLEGEEERLYAQLAAVQARKVARAAGQGGGKSAPGIEAMGSYAAAAPHLRPAPSPAPAPTPAPNFQRPPAWLVSVDGRSLSCAFFCRADLADAHARHAAGYLGDSVSKP